MVRRAHELDPLSHRTDLASSLLRAGRNAEAFQFLQTTTHERLAALGAEMDEFIRKYDHRFRKEEWGSEADSWQRAIRWIAGGVAPD